jgi:hypothetical protein
MIAMAAHAALALETIRPPGHRPLESSAHALVGARVVTKPGQEIEKANIIIRDGRIVAVGADAAVPADARVHDMSGTTIYAGFIDMHVSFAKSASSRTTQGNEGPPVDALDLTSGAGSGFLGVTSAAGEPGTKSVVTPERRMAREFAPEKKALDALRNEGFTAANIVPDAGVIRGVNACGKLSAHRHRFAAIVERKLGAPRSLSRLAHGRHRGDPADAARHTLSVSRPRAL